MTDVMLDDDSGRRLVVAYLRAICEPLLGADQIPGMEIDVAAPFPDEFVFRVTCVRGGGGFLVGVKGVTAEAIRLLVRARARAIGWDARVDVRISRAG